MKEAENVDARASAADVDNEVDIAARAGRGAYPYASIPPPGKEHDHVGPKVVTNHRERFTYILIALGAAVYLYPFLRVLWRIGDEGTLVYGAQRVAQGAVPYRDFFEVMGPGTFYWLGFFFRVFGTSWQVSRALLLITGIATTLIVYWLARRLRSGAEALPALLVLALTIPLWPAINHHWDSNVFALLAFCAFLGWLDRRRPWLLIAAGGLAGVVSVFLQQKGVLLLISFVATIWLLDRKEPRWWSSAVRVVAAYGALGIAVVLGFYAAGALPEFLYANIIWPASNYHNVNSVPYAYGLRELYWSSWVDVLSLLVRPVAAYVVAASFLGPFLLIAALPLLLLVLAVGRRDVAFQRTALPFWTVGVALWLSEIHRTDIMHLIYGSPILLVLCVFLFGQQRQGFRANGVRLLLASTLLFAAFNALIAQAAHVRMPTRRGTVYLHAKDDALDFLDRELAPGEDVFVYPYYPMYYFLTGTKNPTRFSILMYQMNTEAQFREVVASLEQRKVRYVLWDTVVDGPNLKRWFPSYRHPPQEKLIIEQYLTERYELMGYKNGFRVMRRKSQDGGSGINASTASVPSKWRP